VLQIERDSTFIANISWTDDLRSLALSIYGILKSSRITGKYLLSIAEIAFDMEKEETASEKV